MLSCASVRGLGTGQRAYNKIPPPMTASSAYLRFAVEVTSKIRQRFAQAMKVLTIVIHHNCDISHVWHVCLNFANAVRMNALHQHKLRDGPLRYSSHVTPAEVA